MFEFCARNATKQFRVSYFSQTLILDSKQQNRRLILHNCEANVRCENIRAGSFVKVIKAKLIEVLTKWTKLTKFDDTQTYDKSLHSVKHTNIKIFSKLSFLLPRWLLVGSPIFCENFKAVGVFKRAFFSKLNCFVTRHLRFCLPTDVNESYAHLLFGKENCWTLGKHN